MPRPAMRLRILPRFPAQVQATAPIVVSKTAGTYAFTADFSPIGEAPAPALTDYDVLLQNRASKAFIRTRLQDLSTGATDWTHIQNRPTKIDALATLDTSQGAVEQTGTNTFAKRTIGGGGATALVTYGDANLFYQPMNARLSAIASAGVATADIANDAVTNTKAAQMAPLTIKSNITGGTVNPADNTLSAIIDAALGPTRGSVLYRGASSWAVLTPGTAGYVLQTNGAAANPSWAPGAGSFAPNPQVAAGVGQFIKAPGTDTTPFTMPSGGTWLWYCYGLSVASGTVSILQTTGVSAGGTTVAAASAGNAYFGWAWRIS